MSRTARVRRDMNRTDEKEIPAAKTMKNTDKISLFVLLPIGLVGIAVLVIALLPDAEPPLAEVKPLTTVPSNLEVSGGDAAPTTPSPPKDRTGDSNSNVDVVAPLAPEERLAKETDGDLIPAPSVVEAPSEISSPWKGSIAERRKAIADAAQSKDISDVTIREIIDAMASTANDVDPDTGGGGLPSFQDPSADLRKAMGRRPVLLGACCEGLLGIGTRAFKDVLNGLGNENVSVRFGCAWVLCRMGDKDAVIALSSPLDDKAEDKNVRGAAANSLKLLKLLKLLNDARCVPYAERALQSVPMDRGGFNSMTTLIAKYDEVIASKWVCELGKPTQPKDLRQVSAEVAGMLKDRVGGDLLLILLKDQEDMVRLEAA